MSKKNRARGLWMQPQRGRCGSRRSGAVSRLKWPLLAWVPIATGWVVGCGGQDANDLLDMVGGSTAGYRAGGAFGFGGTPFSSGGVAGRANDPLGGSGEAGGKAGSTSGHGGASNGVGGSSSGLSGAGGSASGGKSGSGGMPSAGSAGNSARGGMVGANGGAAGSLNRGGAAGANTVGGSTAGSAGSSAGGSSGAPSNGGSAGSSGGTLANGGQLTAGGTAGGSLAGGGTGGGSAGASGSAGSGGVGGDVCTDLLNTIVVARQLAIQCEAAGPGPGAARNDCTSIVQDECDCDVAVATLNSPSTNDLREAVARFKEAHCTASCTKFSCISFVSGKCQTSGNTHVCVGIAASTGG